MAAGAGGLFSMDREELRRLVAGELRLQTLAQRLYRDRRLRDVLFDLQSYAGPDGGTIPEGSDAPGQATWGAWFEEWRGRLKDAAKVAVLVPAGMLGMSRFSGFPDLDIRVLGIGAHRYFLFHSAISLWAFKWLYDRYCETSLSGQGLAARTARKAAGVALAGAAVGVGVHLLTDSFDPKAIIFPFFGSLVDGTLVDDRVWLLANSVWAFKIARDLLVVALGPDLDRAAAWVRATFVDPLFAPRAAGRVAPAPGGQT